MDPPTSTLQAIYPVSVGVISDGQLFYVRNMLDDLHGVASFSQMVWYDHMRKLMSRLRNFVAKNLSTDPENTRSRVSLYVNKFIGSALWFMQLDNQQWWSGFCEVLRVIDYQSPV
ncbi:unnamed protein product [Phytophthora fragariaefolia]|uniref:Unnamed protein product n=1 Tax=Phytophthora fragariaefolia TaxID=1490495 RepID=A0A9W6UEF6_9STRA|nr:unnamed protein product [Phytophthora fragariaefolia]